MEAFKLPKPGIVPPLDPGFRPPALALAPRQQERNCDLAANPVPIMKLPLMGWQAEHRPRRIRDERFPTLRAYQGAV